MTPLLVLAAVATQVAAGQPLAALPDFLLTSFQVTIGYTTDQSRTGATGWSAEWSSVERLGFLALAFTLASVTAWSFSRRRKPGTSDVPLTSPMLVLLPILTIAAFFFWKAGFVRHDAHSLTAWAGLTLLALAMLPFARQGRGVLAAISLLSTTAFWTSATYQQDYNKDIFHRMVLRRAMLQVDGAWDFLTGHAARHAALDRKQDSSWEAIRQQFPLPPLAGGVDVVSSPGAIVVAAGLDYRPHPVPGYIAMTPALRQHNLRFFSGPDAPDWVLLRPQSHDNRYPMLGDAHLLPSLLADYDWVDTVTGFQLLEHRARARAIRYEALPDLVLPANTWVELPREAGPLWAWLELPVTLWGKAQTALWRPPLLSLGVELADGSRLLFNLPRQTAEGGFLLTPLLRSSPDLIGLLRWLDSGQALGQPIARLRLATDQAGAGHAYDWPARLRLSRLTATGTREYPLSPNLVTNPLEELLASYNADSGPWSPALKADGTLFAHPPLTLTLSAFGAHAAAGEAAALLVSFGIDDAAWQGEPNTNGVCFRIFINRGSAREALLDRCLDPFNQVADRGPQNAIVSLPDLPFDSLSFETDPRGNVYRDWAYWYGITAR